MNRLHKESSPYLQQHAHNPVDWFPWCETAFEKAIEENKPVLVSIGYAACHWCHVMERESFEDVAVANYMNEFFVNIKVDREERPDVDHLYMDALQVITGQGGWPLNIFVTPNKKPFFGGTYFPPKRIYQRASWMETLEAVKLAWELKQDEVEMQSEQLLQHLKHVNIQETGNGFLPYSKADFQQIISKLLQQADDNFGGFGMPPKFPQTMSLRFLMQYYQHSNDKAALQHALSSIDHMLAGGIFDQLGGGLARYSTDAEWLVPHFEKMLYDNALFLLVLAEAYAITSDEKYATAIHDTITFCNRDLKKDEHQKLFYAALDADSEGVEGKYYVWSYDEIVALIPNISLELLKYWNVSPAGNWEGSNILNFDKEQSLSNELKAELKTVKQILLSHRQKKVPPATDTKMLLGWNALMVTALAKCSKSIAQPNYLKQAQNLLDALLETYFQEGNWFRTFDGEKLSIVATLEDLAYLLQALLLVGEYSFDYKYIIIAQDLLLFINLNFSDEAQKFYFFSHKDQEDIVVRKIETYDGAMPSVNAVMAENLLIMSKWFEDETLQSRCGVMLEAMQSKSSNYPLSFSFWNLVMLRNVMQLTLVTGDGVETSEKEEIEKNILHNTIFAIQNELYNSKLPLLNSRPHPEKNLYYLCTQKSCLAPNHDLVEIIFKIKMQILLE